MRLHSHSNITPSLEEYVFAERNVSYSSELYEPSPEELKKIKKTSSSPVSPHKGPMVNGMVKCIIDTDIGTDFDDTLAILYALNLVNLEILGITTNYGPTQLRSSIVHKIVDSYMKYHPNRKNIPIISGANFQIGTHREIFIKGNEGRPFFSKEEIENNYLDPKKWESNSQTEAADFIAQTINSNPGEIKIISIGIMTNIALAFKRNPEIIPKIKEMVVMGGGGVLTSQKNIFTAKYSTDPKQWEKKVSKLEDVLPNDDSSVPNFVCQGNMIHLYPNHNFSGDTMATVSVFEHPIPTKIIPHSVTSKFWLSGHAIQYLHDRANDARSKGVLDDEATEVAGLIMEEWFKLRRGQNGQCPHDPLTVNEAAFGSDQSPIYYVNGTMIIHRWAAYSTFIPHEDGKHLLGIYVHDKDVPPFLDFLGKKITNDYDKEK